MSLYIEFFNGKHSPDEELDDLGFDGPVLGPYDYCHITYGFHVKLGIPHEEGFPDELVIHEENPLYGAYYGDFSVFDESKLKGDIKDRYEKRSPD